MSTKAAGSWLKDFGIEGRKSPSFFSSVAEIDAAGSTAPQPHALRRAFEQLKLDGVLCQDKNPVIYFRVMDRIVPSEVAAIHRLFWNQGVAPILVLIDSTEVHVYSGLTQPAPGSSPEIQRKGFIETLNRVSDELRRFIISVETGEYFHAHRRSFNPRERVDRRLLRHLQAARQRLAEVQAARLEPHTLDALLCRLVFTCYLFDRKVIDRDYLENIGIRKAGHLRDILNRTPRTDAKSDLYKLFSQLGEDFNGDLFCDDLDAEARQVKVDHINIVNDFFQGTDPCSGQQSFWPFEFGIIPIETISAIYEHFLKAAGQKQKKEAGAFYTPRVLAELVLDVALDNVPSLLDKRFLDPACGSGIFLVGLFKRLAEEWCRKNPKAGYDAKLLGLTRILKGSLFGIDKNRTACLIAAFSLYLALLDYLSPPDIRRVLKKVKVLPRLVRDAGSSIGTIRCADYFTADADLAENVHFVVGNPPWASVKEPDSPAARWCSAHKFVFPGRQIAAGFVWKAPGSLEAGGKVCFVLPHGLLFNHNKTALDFHREWLRRHRIELIINLADYQYFLFEEARAPALVVRYSRQAPSSPSHRIEYWTPKTDWTVTQAEVISVLPQDRCRVTVREVFDDLTGDDAPQIWKERFWATTRDRRLLDRLRIYPRLREILGQRGDRSAKRWIIAEGFEPFGQNDPPASRRRLSLPHAARVEANTHKLNLLVLPDEVNVRQPLNIDVRRSISDTQIFKAPLVLVTEGFSKVAFADVDIAYRHGIRGIRGPSVDSNLLAFLTFYLRSPIARYFLFHTSASWGISRARVDVDDLLRLPFPLPHQMADPLRANAIVKEAAAILSSARKQAVQATIGRDEIVREAQSAAEPLLGEYFDVDDIERMLVSDTDSITIPSARPGRTRVDAPTMRPATDAQRVEYLRILCNTLNGWAAKGCKVHGRAMVDASMGLGVVLLEKTRLGERPANPTDSHTDILKVLSTLQRGAAKGHSVVELVRGLKVFDGRLLYITKPVGRRFWSRTAALNDADEIAGTILMRSTREGT